MKEPTRRAWSRPELIVLVRSRPEEAVLAVCKINGWRYEISSNVDWNLCQVGGAIVPPCFDCDIATAS